jgi:hypothetical protein
MPFLGTTGGGSVKQYGGQASLGYFIKNSLRTRASANGYLSRTPPSGSGGQTYTISVWVKRGTLGTAQAICSANYTNSTFFDVFFNTGNTLNISLDAGTGSVGFVSTSVYRDPSAWYHIMIVGDHTNATEANRLKIFVNGVAAPGTYTYPSTGFSTSWNIGTRVHGIGVRPNASFQWYFDGYMAEFHSVDGQALTPSSFGKTDAATGQWIPKKYLSTYGTNGFYLKFADASAATAAAIGKDSSPNGNNWTPTNISVTAGVTYDAMIDSPSLSGAASNYAVMNPLDKTSVSTVSNGNLKVVSTAGGFGLTRATMAIPSTGKFYFEVTLDTGTTDDSTWVGVIDSAETRVFSSGFTTTVARSYVETGGKNSGSATTSYGTSYTSGDVIGIAVDMTNGAIYFAKNNTWQNSGDPTSGATKTGAAFTDMSTAATGSWIPFCHDDSSQTPEWTWNFGQRPFAYTPPSGFKSLNTFNLP